MGIDVLFQPVDLKQWETVLFPYLRGHGSLDGLFKEARRLAALRLLVHETRSAVVSYEPDPSYPDWYDHDLMTWFRPYFVVGRDAEENARLVAAYQRATPAEAVELVRGEVRRIAPDRADAVKKPPRRKADPLDVNNLTELRKDLRRLRTGYAGLARDPSAVPGEAIEAYDREIYDALLQLNEELQPHWHIRAWFLDALLPDFGVRGWRKLCEPIQRLFTPLFATLPAESVELLSAPDDLGFIARPNQVPALRELVGKRLTRLGPDLSGDHDNRKRALISLHETLTYCEHHQLAFAEKDLLMLAALITLIAPPTPPLVTIQEGTLPIILSAPHGGGAALPGVPQRLGVGVPKFVIGRDTNTDRLAEKLAAALEKRMGGKPYVVIARFSRRYVDANRDAKNAYEHPLAKPYHDTYHGALADAKKAVVTKWGRGLLLDLHAQGAKRDTVFRGTNNGKSVTHLTDRFGRGAFVGPKSVMGMLEKKGYTVFPKCDSDARENPNYSGGWITQHYGSRDGGTLDAIQLETGGDHRTAKNIDRFATDLADAAAEFAAEFLPAGSKAGR